MILVFENLFVLSSFLWSNLWVANDLSCQFYINLKLKFVLALAKLNVFQILKRPKTTTIIFSSSLFLMWKNLVLHENSWPPLAMIFSLCLCINWERECLKFPLNQVSFLYFAYILIICYDIGNQIWSSQNSF